MEVKKTILLVEDEILLLLSNKIKLERMGYLVLSANSGEEAIILANVDSSIDLILMDIVLGSDINGISAAEEILKYREIPIIFYSNQTDAEIVKRANKISSYGFIEKFAHASILNTSIATALKLFEEKKLLKAINM